MIQPHRARNRATLVLSLALLPTAVGCTIPGTLSDLERESPPEAYGRPRWVRTTAQVGATVGAVVGGLTSVVFLPVTYPISLLADEPLGMADDEFVFFPVAVGAGAGHFLFGGPADLFDFSFRRAWVGSPRPTDYDFTPQPPPQHRALVEASVDEDDSTAAEAAETATAAPTPDAGDR